MKNPISGKASSIAATPMAFVRSMVEGARLRSLDPTAALASAGIDASALADAKACITATQMERVSGQLMREMDDEALGWFARPLPWGSYGMLARASISSGTLGLAMKRWCRHHALLTNDIELHLDQPATSDAQHASVTLVERCAGRWLAGDLRTFCHVSMLRNFLGLSSWLVDSRITPACVRLAFPKPPYSDVFPLLFGGTCEFDHPRTQLLFDRHYLELPLRRDDTALYQLLKRALPLTVHSYRKDRLLVSRVRHAMLNDRANLQNAQALATGLHTSVRTLHRQLKDEGASLQSLKDDVRRVVAIDMLLKSDQPLKSIAFAVGMENEKSFLRAFKRWTGDTPHVYRQRSPGTVGGRRVLRA